MNYFPNMITGRQIRMARAGLGWSIDKLALEARVNKNTIVRLEKDMVDTRRSSIESIQRTLEVAGAQFIEHGVVMAPQNTNVRQRLDGVRRETVEKFVYEFWCSRVWDSLNESASAAEILDKTNPDRAFASAIAQLSLEMGYTNARIPRQLASILDALSNTPFALSDGASYTIVSNNDHGDDLLMTRWKMVRGE